MSLLGGLGFNPVNLLATAAFGPAGGIVAQLATQVFSQFGQQLLQNLGQQAGLPQSQIDLAQADLTNRFGDFPGTMRNLDEALDAFGQETRASPSDIANLQRESQDAIKNILRQAADSMETDDVKDAKAGGKGTGWLRALAEALGEAADKAADRLEQQAKGLDDASPSESAEYSADAQAFSMLMNAINTAIKSIGESLGTMAKRQ